MITFSHLSALKGIEHGITEKGDVVPEFIRGEQVHKNSVAQVHATDESPIKGVDALVTRERDLTLGVYTADCVPMLFVDLSSGVIGTIHAGWRGTALDIARKTIEFLKIRPGNISVGIGPAICGRCFEVGPEVAKQFDAHLVTASQNTGKFLIDLWQANVEQLLAIGVKEKNIEGIRRCTMEDDSLYSYRNGDRIDRNVAFIRRVL